MGTHLWDVSTTERPSRITPRMRSHRNLRACGSIPVVGSSCNGPGPGSAWAGPWCCHGASQCPPHQEDNRGAAEEGDGRGELAFVAPAVLARRPIRVRAQPQSSDAPLSHLQRETEG